jgi:hypothetical protein
VRDPTVSVLNINVAGAASTIFFKRKRDVSAFLRKENREMKDTERRIYEMLVRVDEYGTVRSADFPQGSAGGDLFASLHDLIALIDDKASAQSSGFSLKREGTATRNAARKNLRRQLEAINRTAVSLSLAGTMPGLENRFRMPRGNNDQTLLSTGRAFAENAPPLATHFVGLGLPQEFATNLNAAITEFEKSINQQNTGRDSHVAATSAISEALERAVNVVHRLDAIVRNKYANDPPQLSAWQSASHIERPPQRAKKSAPPPAK